jgi:hypothetical protein
MSQTFNDRVQAELRKYIQANIDQIKNNMVHGGLVDFAHYKYQAGIAAGLALIDELLEEARKAVQEDH